MKREPNRGFMNHHISHVCGLQNYHRLHRLCQMIRKQLQTDIKRTIFFFVFLYVFWFNSPLSASSILIRPENNIETVTKANTHWLWRFTIFCYVPNNDINDGASPDPFGFMSVPTFNVRD